MPAHSYTGHAYKKILKIHVIHLTAKEGGKIQELLGGKHNSTKLRCCLEFSPKPLFKPVEMRLQYHNGYRASFLLQRQNIICRTDSKCISRFKSRFRLLDFPQSISSNSPYLALGSLSQASPIPSSISKSPKPDFRITEAHSFNPILFLITILSTSIQALEALT